MSRARNQNLEFPLALVGLVLCGTVLLSGRPEISLSTQISAAPKLLFVLTLGALLLELRSLEPGGYGRLSSAGGVYLAALATPGLGPPVALLIASLALGLRALVDLSQGRQAVRNSLLDGWPVAASAVLIHLTLSKFSEPLARLLVAAFLYAVSSRLLLNTLVGHESEARQTRTRFILANLLASLPVFYLLQSEEPWTVLFLIPLLLIVQHGGYGLVLQSRQLKLREVTEKLKNSQRSLRSAVESGKSLSRQAKKKEMERQVVDALAHFFASSPSLEDILGETLQVVGRITDSPTLILAEQHGKFSAKLCAQELKSFVQEMPDSGFEDPFLTRCLEEGIFAGRGEQVDFQEESEFCRRLGSGLLCPVSDYGLICVRLARPLSEKEMTVLVTLCSQVSLGLRAAEFRAKLQQALGERTEALEQLRASQAQLVQSGKMAAVGQLAAALAHEVNSPLATVLLQVQSAQLRLQKGKLDKAGKSLQTAEKAVHRAKDIIERLLRFSHKSDGDSELLGLDTLIDDTLAFVGKSLSDDGVEVEWEPAEESPQVMGDPVALQQVLTNLLLNAKDAVLQSATEDKPLIKVMAEERDGSACLLVSDNGGGIPEEIQGRIFEPFFSTKRVGSGTGLGLSISKDIVEGQGGELSFDSSPTGTSFVVRLPLSRP